jgi:undecaprenyl diphosphate synthase
VQRIVEAAVDRGIGFLTLFAFSAANWQRPVAEVSQLMDLFERHLVRETARCLDNGIRLNILGRRDRLRPRLVRAIEKAETTTAKGTNLVLRIAVDYSARQMIARAAASLATRCRAHLVDEQTLESEILSACHSEPAVPPVDLLIRTSGERRLSDFLLWECAYAELYFTPVLWPDFGADDLAEALLDYQRRERRFGGLPAPQVAQAGAR